MRRDPTIWDMDYKMPPNREELIDRLDKIDFLLATENKWCKHYPALTASGEPCLPNDKDAVKLCVLGAVILVTGNKGTKLDINLNQVLQQSSKQIYGIHVTSANDKFGFLGAKYIISNAKKLVAEGEYQIT